MMDRETGSLWSHITGECLEGEFVGAHLEQWPSVQTTWEQWVAAHPETRVLKKSKEVAAAQYQKYFDDPDRIGILPMTWQQDQMPGKTLVQGLLVAGTPMAVRDSDIPPTGTLDLDVGEIRIVIGRDPDGGVRARRSDTDEEITVRLAYWFAWSAYFPETAIHSDAQPRQE
jgi:Protein of unknown function (DUF3179)